MPFVIHPQMTNTTGLKGSASFVEQHLEDKEDTLGPHKWLLNLVGGAAQTHASGAAGDATGCSRGPQEPAGMIQDCIQATCLCLEQQL